MSCDCRHRDFGGGNLISCRKLCANMPLIFLNGPVTKRHTLKQANPAHTPQGASAIATWCLSSGYSRIEHHVPRTRIALGLRAYQSCRTPPPSPLQVTNSETDMTRSGAYVTQLTAIGPLGLAYVDPADDARRRHPPAS